MAAPRAAIEHELQLAFTLYFSGRTHIRKPDNGVGAPLEDDIVIYHDCRINRSPKRVTDVRGR